MSKTKEVFLEMTEQGLLGENPIPIEEEQPPVSQTKERTYEGGTEFSLWIRKQQELDSHLGYRCYDIDYVWTNANSLEWMNIEEKRFGWQVRDDAWLLFKRINRACASDKNYRGFHLLVFENTSPEDGLIQLNHQDITPEDLIKFFQFDKEILYKYTHEEVGKISQKFRPKLVDKHIKLNQK